VAASDYFGWGAEFVENLVTHVVSAGIMQHHDALTGTGGAACDLEFHTMLRNATELAEQVIANATAALIRAPALEVYSIPAIPPAPAESVCATHGCVAPTGAMCAVSNYTDCAGHGAPSLPGGNSQASCNARGCCWGESSAHSWCWLPKNEALHPAPSPPPAADGTVLTVPPIGQRLPIIAANPLGWNRSDVISVRVLSASPNLKVTSGSGEPIVAQLAPPEPVSASVASHAARHDEWAKWATGGATKELVMSRLIVPVGLLPLGSTTLFLGAAEAGAAGSVAISSIKHGDGNTGFSIANGVWSLRLSPTGLVDTATEVGAGSKTLIVNQDIKLYWGNSGKEVAGDGGSESDAYVFAPQGPASSIARHAADAGFWPGGMAKKNLSASTVSITGPVMKEISTCFGVTSTTPTSVFVESAEGGVWQAVRLFDLSPPKAVPTALERTIETSYFVSALNNNIDVVSKLDTGLNTAGLLHTDEAG
jgi:hypothetical protein